MENEKIAKMVYVGVYVGSRSVGRPRKMGIDTVKICLNKRGFDVRQARRMVHDSSVMRGSVRGNVWGFPCGATCCCVCWDFWSCGFCR